MHLIGFRLNRLSLLTIATLAIAPSEARGQLVQDGVPVGSTGMLQVQDESRVAPDSQGGSFIAWREERLNTSTAEDIYLQHVLQNGLLDPAWPVSGLPIVLEQTIQSPTHLVPDGAGGAIVVWLDGRNGSNDVFALRVNAVGQRPPGWSVSGNPICIAEGSQVFTTACSDGNGGAYIAWDDYRDGTARARLTHILENGTIAPGWETNATLLTDHPGASGIRILLK